MFHLEALAERLPLMSIFQNMTFIHYVQRLAIVTKIAKFNLPSIIIIIGKQVFFFCFLTLNSNTVSNFFLYNLFFFFLIKTDAQ